MFPLLCAKKRIFTAMINVKQNPIIPAIISGLLFWAAWPAAGFAPLLWIAMIPLLFLEDQILNDEKHRKGRRVFIYAFIAFLVWNILSTWWVKNASFFGAVAAITLNTFFMTGVFWLFHKTRAKLGNVKGYLSLIFYWIAFEYLHLNWDISWTWLNLGNGFAAYTSLIQWYEYTGIFGGTLWILSLNILFYNLIKRIRNKDKSGSIRLGLFTGFLFFVPILLSIYIFQTYKEKSDPVNVIVVQPNIDPYKEKFGGMSQEAQLFKFLKLGVPLVDEKTDYLVGPETALPMNIWEDELPTDSSIVIMGRIMEQFPKLNIVVGISSNKFYPEGTQASESARNFRNSPGKYDSYNTAIQLSNGKDIQIYHKSKLVPGVEKMPWPKLLGFLETFAIDLGGTTGSLGTQKERTNLDNGAGIKIAPSICYESIYGEFMAEYVFRGAQLIFIITNDGWWGDTPGYRQHFQYARLRAIETRRSVARSANTGISGFINQRGDILQSNGWWHEDALKAELNKNDHLTFYVKMGDYIARLSSFLAVMMLLYMISSYLGGVKKKQ